MSETSLPIGGNNMKILVTGANGFIGKNILSRLSREGGNEIVAFDIDTPEGVLESAVVDCDFVLHFAGVNRPKDVSEFKTGNFDFTAKLIEKLKAANSRASFLITSSIQAALDNPYGKSKKAAEDFIFEYAEKAGVDAYVYRLPNVFGKWCKPNYNSAIATFCNNIARGLPITVNDPNVDMHVVYIDDVADEIIRALNGKPTRGDGVEIDKKYCMVPVTYRIKLGKIVDMIRSFKQSRTNLEIADMTVGSLSAKLYSTYLSYLPEDDFSYPLNMHIDGRGSFTEFIRTIDRGQVSVNITRPHIVKGNHWHHSKNEKYLVVKGSASIRFRKLGEDRIIEYITDGDNLKVVDIPPGYVHCIENIGDDDLVTLMWANEPFNPQKPDTYPENV